MQNIYGRIIKGSIYSLAFLAPIFFLPLTFEAFELNKQYLMLFLVSLGFLSWLAKMIFVDKEIRVKRTILDIPILAFLSVAVISAVFSADKFSSLFGTFGRFSNGLITLMLSVVFYYVVINNPVKISAIIKAILGSSFIAALFSYFSLFGIWQKISQLLGGKLPAVMLQKFFNPVSGSMEGLAAFLSVVLIFLVGILLNRGRKQKTEEGKRLQNGGVSKFILWALFLFFFFLLVILDIVLAWVILILSLALFIAFAIFTRTFREDVNKLLLPIFLVIAATALIFVNLPETSFNSFSRESILGQRESWDIALKTAVSSPKNIFLGSGVGTFADDFSQFKTADFNKIALWQYRFDRPGNSYAEILASTGFLGILSYLALIVLFLATNLAFLKVKTPAEGDSVKTPALVLLFGLIICQFFYCQNSVLIFIFWLALAMNFISLNKSPKELKYSFQKFPEAGLIFNVVMALIVCGFLGIFFYAGKFYLADIAYAKALTAQTETAAVFQLEKAVKLNPYQSQFRIVLSRVYLSQALNEISKSDEEQDKGKIQNGIANAVEQARIATENSPKSVLAWENRGVVYSNIGTMVNGVADWAATSFERAIVLDPTNPALHTELGKLLLGKNNEEAGKEFDKALILKQDYADALIQKAFLLEGEGNLEGAVKKMEELVSFYPYDPAALFQLGRFYYNNNRLDDAIISFQKAVYLSPNYSNVRYALGVAYGAKGEKELAISEFEKVLELNPGNQDVIDKIEELKK